MPSTDYAEMIRLRSEDARTWTYAALAARFGVHKATISRVLGRQAPALQGWAPTGPIDIAEMAKLRADDPDRWTHQKLAERYGVSQPAIAQALNKHAPHLKGVKPRGYPLKINVPEALALRKADPKVWTQRKLAERYNVSRSAIYFCLKVHMP